MFSKTAARSKSYFLGLPAAAMAMGHSTVVQPIRRMRTKVRKTTAKFRRHAPLAPAIEDGPHNTAVLTPVLAPLSPLEIETWCRRCPSPPPPSSSASTSSSQNQFDSESGSAFQRQDSEDFDARSASQVRGNPLWAQRFLPGLRIPSGFDMNNYAGAQSLSPISPLPSPISPSPLYPSTMISPMSFYSQDSVPHNDHSYPSTIDTAVSLTTPITDIFMNTDTNFNDNNENDGDLTLYGHGFTNTQRFGISEATDYTTDGQMIDNSIAPHEAQTDTPRFSGSEAIEYTMEGQYGARMKELPSPRIHDIQDIDALELGPPAKAPTIIELPADTSLRYVLSGQEFAVVINEPTRADSAFDDQAIDDIQRAIVASSFPIAKISIAATAECLGLPYAGHLINDIFSVLQGCKMAPDEISVSLSLGDLTAPDHRHYEPLLLGCAGEDISRADFHAPRETSEPQAFAPSHALRQALRNIRPLSPWWFHGRLSFSQLRRISLCYPLPLSDFVELLSCSPGIEIVHADWLTPTCMDKTTCPQGVFVPRLTTLSLACASDLEPLFDAVTLPSLRILSLVINETAQPHKYDLQWDKLEEVVLRCGMTSEVENRVKYLCQNTQMKRIVNSYNIVGV